MPKHNIDYSKTVMYKIVCNDLSILHSYAGHSSKYTTRKSQHKYSCNNGDNKKIYQIIRENGGWENWTMLQIESYPCANEAEASLRERYWYEQLNADMNTYVPSRTKHEIDISEEKRAREKIRRVSRKAYLKEYARQYYIDNKK